MINLDHVIVIEILEILGLSLILYFPIRKVQLIYKAFHEDHINNKSFEILFKSIYQGNFDEETLSRVFNYRNEKLINSIFYYDTSYERFLELFLIYSIKNDSNGSYTNRVNETIQPIFQRIKDNNPYPNVNERERRILLSINDTTKKSANLTESEKAAIKHNLDDLAMALEENQNALKKSMNTNNWSIPVSIIGVLLTLIFGIIQLIQSYSSG